MGCMSFLALCQEKKNSAFFMFQIGTLSFISLNERRENNLDESFFQVDIFTEEMIRAGSAAALSLLLNRLDPVLRKTASLGRFVHYPLPTH